MRFCSLRRPDGLLGPISCDFRPATLCGSYPFLRFACSASRRWRRPISAPPPAPPLTPTHRVDQARAALDQLEKELSNRTVSDAQLAELRGKIDPIETSAKEVDAELTPVLAGIKARLDQLGAKPADNAPPESAQVTAERAEQQKRLADVDEVLKRARLIAVQADQTADHIASRRRELFTSALLQRTNSLFDANLWSDVARDLPRDFRGTDMLASDFWSNASERLTGWWRAAFAAMIFALIAIYVAATGISRRVVTHEPSIEDPTRFRKVRAALWIGMVVAVVPIASVTLFFALFNGFDLIGGRLEPLVRAIIIGVIRIALAAGLCACFASALALALAACRRQQFCRGKALAPRHLGCGHRFRDTHSRSAVGGRRRDASGIGSHPGSRRAVCRGRNGGRALPHLQGA